MHRVCRMRYRTPIAFMTVNVLLVCAAPASAQTSWQSVAEQQGTLIRQQQAQIEALSRRLSTLEKGGAVPATQAPITASIAPVQQAGDPGRSAVQQASTSSLPPTPSGPAISPAPISAILAALPANGTTLPSRGFMSVPGTAAVIRIGGRIQAEGLFFPNAGAGESEDFIVPRLINGNGPTHDRTRLTARDSRVLTDVRLPAGPLGGIRAYTEWDFLGSVPTNSQAQFNAYEPRMRHLFLEVGPGVGSWSFLAGQTWSAFNDVSSYADIYNGLIFGAVFVREPQFRLTKWFGRKWSVAVSLENPDGDVSGATGAQANEQFDALPDVVVTTRTEQSWGRLQAGLLLRQIEETSPADRRFAWGMNLSGTIPIKSLGRDNARFQVNYGNGIGRYIGELGPGFDGIVRPGGKDGFALIKTFAGNVSYKHFWSDRFASSLALSEVLLDNPIDATATALKRTRTATGTLVFTPADSLEFGIEFTLADKQTKDGESVSRPFSRFVTRFNF